MQLDDRKTAELALIENLQREDLNAVEEAEGYRALIDEYGLTQEELSRRIGKSRSAVTNALRLLDLPEKVTRVTLQPEGREIPFTVEDGRICFTLDRFHCHAIVEMK